MREVAGVVLISLVANELTSVSPWAAQRLVRWAARLRYRDPSVATRMAEDQSALVLDIPGNVVKLAFAVHFGVAAITWRVRSRWIARGDERSTQLSASTAGSRKTCR